MTNVMIDPGQQAQSTLPYRTDSTAPADATLRSFLDRATKYHAAFCFTPPSVTELYLLLVLALRLPLTFVVEKCWFTTLAIGRAIEQLIRSSPCRVRFGDHYLHKPVIRWLTARDLPRLVGRVVRIEARLYEKPGPVTPPMAMGVLLDFAIHLLSVMVKLFPEGKLDVVSAFAARAQSWAYPSESFVSLRGWVDPDGKCVPYRLEAAKEAPVAEKVIEVTGTRACLRIDINAETATLQPHGGPARVVFSDATSEAPGERPYDHILRCLQVGDVEQIGLDIQEALRVWGVIEAARQLLPATPVVYRSGSAPD